MKIIFLTFFLVACTYARTAVQPQPMQTNVIGPACPIDDPLNIEEPLAINITADPLLKLVEGSQITNLIANGLTSLHYNLSIDCVLFTVPFELTLGHAEANANFIAKGYLDARPFRHETIPSGNVTGFGLGKISTDNLYVNGKAFLRGDLQRNRFHLENLTIETISFSAFNIDLGGNFTVGGEIVDWGELSRNFKANFDQDLANYREAITEKIRLAANTFVKRYTLYDLFEFFRFCAEGDGDAEDCSLKEKHTV